MTVVEFMILVLTTQTHVLQRLAAFFGEEQLLEILESVDDFPAPKESTRTQSLFSLQKNWFIPAPLQVTKTSPYTELEGSVRELNLPATLEFHLWAYPFYRTLIESSLDLKMTFNPKKQGGEALVKEALYQAKTWIHALPIHPAHAAQVQTLGMTPWVRFQSEVLKKTGGRPLNPL